MEPAINHGDRVAVFVPAYQLSEPERSDIVVVANGDETLIKRVVGLPGEFIAVRDCEVRTGRSQASLSAIDEPYLTEENLTPGLCGADSAPVELGSNEVFVLGDNRSVSLDSRILGPMKVTDVAGQVVYEF